MEAVPVSDGRASGVTPSRDDGNVATSNKPSPVNRDPNC